ncbi:cyclase family protein [Ruicaihuangia caeni]|uniref:Cyclase family protein n=1 Tax=Ruicaihuangia caeni TaxID=3042517 RepID=A0AAW6T639_9MICO|nr:cyclase family protein [Klugiella sp. YN-L-19]MDI2098694.1 cyclase family protein [Klugiella sp. YN-L-19]
MSSRTRGLPSCEKPWAELPEGSAHGVFGADDVLGTLNRQSPETVLGALSAAVMGRVFSLNLPLDQPEPALFQRQFPRHRVFTTPRGNLDDVVDNFYPQSSSQWDGFLHVPDPELGFYNGLGRDEHGVHHWASRGIVGRGVVLDISEAIAAAGSDAFASRTPVDVEALEAVRRAAGVEYRRGDILVVRTGWISWFREQDAESRARVRDSRAAPGLEGSAAMAEYLWDHGFIAVASDSPGVEALPSSAGSLHHRVLARLGMPLGELWWLDDLAADCAADGRHEAMVVSSPMNLVGGVGSPANAIAIR